MHAVPAATLKGVDFGIPSERRKESKSMVLHHVGDKNTQGAFHRGKDGLADEEHHDGCNHAHQLSTRRLTVLMTRPEPHLHLS